MKENMTQTLSAKSSQAPASILCLGLGWFPKTPGGLERYVYELTQTLAANQDYVDLCGVGLPEEEGDFPIKFINLTSPTISLPKRLWNSRNNFKNYLKNKDIPKPDAINLHFALYSLPILDLLPKDVPITFNFHGPWASESQQESVGQLAAFHVQQMIEKKVYSRCDRFIVLSEAFGQILHQQYGIAAEKINVIPGGVDINHFQPNLTRQEARSKLGWHLHRPTIFTSRRLVNRMGLDKLLIAISLIKQQIPDIWLAIGGRGPLRETLQNQVKELGLKDNVKFLGFLPEVDLPIAYQGADLTIMPSQSLEGFGLAMIESLACGTPTLCTPVGGMPEILKPFAPDLITSSCEAQAIASSLEMAILGKIPMPSRNECRDYAVNNYNWDKITQQVRQVLLKGN
jgi:glycosyltransferase involved in cell wall biosynthesis